MQVRIKLKVTHILIYFYILNLVIYISSNLIQIKSNFVRILSTINCNLLILFFSNKTLLNCAQNYQFIVKF